jgi:type VI protein secretion system component VasK
LRWMRTTCLVLCVTMCAVTAVLIHKNQVANRIYFAQVQKQIQQNAQRVAKTNQEGR